MRELTSLADVVGDYDAVLCDVWGVIHDGRTVHPGAAEALRRARAAGLAVVLVTNVPRPGSTMPRALARLGFPDDAWDAVVTSGDVIRADLAVRAPGPVCRLGRTTDKGLWDDLPLTFVDDPARAEFLAIAGLSDSTELPEVYLPVLRAARERDLELLCANPDVQVPSGDRLLWCAGSVAELYRGMGGRVVQSGKPYDPIYDQALGMVSGLLGRHVDPDRVLAIGDGIGTDVLGAAAHGLDCVFIASGIHGDSLVAAGGVDVPRAQAALDDAGVSAAYTLAHLR